MHQQSAERVRREIILLCHTGLDSPTLRIEIIKRLRKVIPIDVFFFTTADPATLLFTGAVVDEILERATSQFLEHEDASRGFAPSALQVGAYTQSAFHFAHGLAAFRIARLFG